MSATESEYEIILAYGELGNLIPVDVGESVVLSGRLHCLADAVTYSGLSNSDMDIDVHGCLVYGTGGDYNTSAAALWQAYQDNK